MSGGPETSRSLSSRNDNGGKNSITAELHGSPGDSAVHKASSLFPQQSDINYYTFDPTSDAGSSGQAQPHQQLQHSKGPVTPICTGQPTTGNFLSQASGTAGSPLLQASDHLAPRLLSPASPSPTHSPVPGEVSERNTRNKGEDNGIENSEWKEVALQQKPSAKEFRQRQITCQKEEERRRRAAEARARQQQQRRVIPPAPPRQLFLLTNETDDPYAPLLDTRGGVSATATPPPAGLRPFSPKRRTPPAGPRARENGAEDEMERTTVFYPSPTSPWPGSNRRSTFPRQRLLDVELSPASRSAATLPPASSPSREGGGGRGTAAARAGQAVIDGYHTNSASNREAADPLHVDASTGDAARPSAEKRTGTSPNKGGGKSHRCRRPHAHRHRQLALPRHFSHRFFEPVELQVESLSSVAIHVVFALWYLMVVACIVVEVIPQAQWSVVNVCGRGYRTDLRRWERWSSPCMTQSPSTDPSLPAGSMDVSWQGSGLGFLNDNLKLYRRVAISLPRWSQQTAEKQTYHLHARVSATPSSTLTAVDFAVKLTCQRKYGRCDMLRLSGEMALMHPASGATGGGGTVEVKLLGLLPELAAGMTNTNVSVGVVYQKRAYTLGSLIWRYVFLLLSLLHLLRFIACCRYTSALYEQSWVILLQIALFWYLDPIYVLNVVVRPLPAVLAFLEFRMPTYFIAITIAFMFSVMTSSMYWTQGSDAAKQEKVAKRQSAADATGKKRTTKKDAADKAENNQDTNNGDEDGQAQRAEARQGDGKNQEAPSSSSSSSSTCSECDTDSSNSDGEGRGERVHAKSAAVRVFSALFTSPSVYDPPAWTKIVTATYLIAVFALDIVDASLNSQNWSAGSNSNLPFKGIYWAVIALLLLGGVVCLVLLYYLRNYLGNKPYLESRPQQLACRVFIMVFFATVVYYIIHCFVLFFHHNHNYAAAASQAPFLQIPALMIACGFTNIMTLIYASRNRNEGVPIHPTDPRWKFMVWPDTWYRWLSRHGGSQYIFSTEEEETNFYKLQFEFRKRQYLAKLKRRQQQQHHHSHSRHTSRRGSRMGSFVETWGGGDDTTWMSEVASTTLGPRGNLVPRTQPASQAVSESSDTAAVEASSTLLTENKGTHRRLKGQPAASATTTAVSVGENDSRHSPAEYQSQLSAELIQQISASHGGRGGSTALCRPGRGDVEAEDTVCVDDVKHYSHKAPRCALDDMSGGGNQKSSWEVRMASTLNERDLRALLQRRHAGTDTDEEDDKGRVGEDTAELVFSRTHTYMPGIMRAGKCNDNNNRNDSQDIAFQHLYGKKILNMDRFSTYFLADGKRTKPTSHQQLQSQGPLGEREFSHKRSRSAYVTGSTPESSLCVDNARLSATYNGNAGAGEFIGRRDGMGDHPYRQQSASHFPVEGPARRRSRLLQQQQQQQQHHQREMSVSFLDDGDPTTHPPRSQSYLVPRSRIINQGELNGSRGRSRTRHGRQSGTAAGDGAHADTEDGHDITEGDDVLTTSTSTRRQLPASAVFDRAPLRGYGLQGGHSGSPFPPLTPVQQTNGNASRTGSTAFHSRTHSGGGGGGGLRTGGRGDSRRASDADANASLTLHGQGAYDQDMCALRHSGNGACGGRAAGDVLSGPAFRAYEQFVPDRAIDGSTGDATVSGQSDEKPDKRVSTLLARSLVRARNKLGELVGTAQQTLLERPMRQLEKLEMGFFDAAYRPFQTTSYLPFFNLETAVDCYNMSWEAYGVEESAGDAAIETGLKVAPQNVPQAAMRGVKKFFFGCCPASESNSEYDEGDGEQQGESDTRTGATREEGEETVIEMELVPDSRRGEKEKSKSNGAKQQAEHPTEEEEAPVRVPVRTTSPSLLSQATDTLARDGSGMGTDGSTVVSSPFTPTTTALSSSSPPPQQQPQQPEAATAAANVNVAAPVEATPQPAAATAGQLPINVEKYGFKLLFVCVVKEVQVLMAKMDTDEPEHHGKAPRIIIAFRGTANMSNAKYDMNIHRVVWKEMEEPLPNRSKGNNDNEEEELERASTVASTVYNAYLGCASCCRSLIHKTSWRPTCHAGFLAIWRAMKPKVMPKLLEVLRGDPNTVYRIFMTGHSLGGALASLCAYSAHRAMLKMDYPIPDVTVYTYGQPRMGNRTFRRLYDKAVPRSFRIMNESDMVVTFTMLGGYHVGIEVDVDRNGNFIVKPTDIEKMFTPTKGRGIALMNHLMVNYGISMNAMVARTQCPARGLGCYITADPEKIRREKEKEEEV